MIRVSHRRGYKPERKRISIFSQFIYILYYYYIYKKNTQPSGLRNQGVQDIRFLLLNKLKIMRENELGKIPPQAIKEEESILSCLLISKDSIYETAGKLLPEHFYVDAHQKIYTAILELYKNSQGIDMITVSNQMKKNKTLEEIGGVVRLAEISNILNTIRNLPVYVDIVIDAYNSRTLIGVLNEKSDELYDGELDVKDVIQDLESSLYKLTNNALKKEPNSVSKGLSLAVKNIEKFNAKELVGVPTPFSKLNGITGGWQGGDLIIIGGRPSQGKGLKMDEKILTNEGWVLNKDLKIGQQVISTDGSKSEVVGLYPQGLRQFYKITFTDNRFIECDDQHLWEVTSSKFNRHGGTKILSTMDLIEKLTHDRYINRMHVPYFNGDYGSEKKFMIHPYILGVLLGDGCLTSGFQWNKPDEELAIKVSSYLPDGFMVGKCMNNNWSIKSIKHKNTNILKEEMKRFGLMGLRSYEKFIPEEYFHASRDQRLQLLNGLLDTDGCVNIGGGIEFSTSSEQLAFGLQQLAFSLGYRCSLNHRIGKLYGVEHRINYRLNISGKYCGELFCLSRKKDRLCHHNRYLPLTIKSIEKTNVYESQCIAVSAKDSLFITKDYIVTHNTQMAIECIISALETKNPVLFFSCEMSEQAISTRLISHETGISNDQIRLGLTDDDWQQIEIAIGKLEKYPLLIDDTAAIPITELISKAKRAKIKHNISLVVVDYLQLITNPSKTRGQSRDEVVGEITKALKSLAKSLEIPVIALSQLNRMTEMKGDKRPSLSNLRESGDIEAAADIVAFVHNPEFYSDPDAEHCTIEFNIKKNRNGRIDDIKVRRKENWQSLYDYSF